MSQSIGADAPRGPGWWLASDGRYYPPELAAPATQPSTPSPSGAEEKRGTAPRPAKKAAARPSSGAATGGPKKKIKKKVVKKKAPRAAAGPPPEPDGAVGTSRHQNTTSERTTEFDDTRPGHLKYTATPPGSDQVAARRVQAKEQLVLLSDARQDAALRLLGSLADEVAQPTLVGAGPRALDARPETSAGSGVARARSAEPGSSQPEQPPAETSAPEPTANERATARAGTPTPPGSEPGPDPVATGESTFGASDSAALVVPPHQPVAGPAPSTAPMGTDVPFMEVKGSALGTDIDRIGEKILIFADRVELRDRNNAVRQTIRYDQLAAVEVQKKLMGPTLLVASTAGATMTAKALRPELATGAKAMITKHAERYRHGDQSPARHSDPVRPEPTPPPSAQRSEAPAARSSTPPGNGTSPGAPASRGTSAEKGTPRPASRHPEPGGATPGTADGMAVAGVSRPKTHHSVLMAMLNELHAAGILTRDELEAKRSLVDPDSLP